MPEVTIRIPEVDAVLSYGHGEYMPNFPEHTLTLIWDPYNEHVTDRNGETLLTWIEEHAENVEDMTAKWVEVTGLPAERMPEADLQWESVYRVVCTHDIFDSVFEDFRTEIADSDPSGDDDVFDYWPSAARLLIAMGAVLGADQQAEAVRVVRQTIFENIGHYEGELLHKTNTWQEGDPE